MPDWNPLGFINFPMVLQTPKVRDFVSTFDTYLTPKEINWSDEMAKTQANIKRLRHEGTLQGFLY